MKMTFKAITIIFIGFVVVVDGHVKDLKGFSLPPHKGNYAVSISNSSGIPQFDSRQENPSEENLTPKWIVPLYLFASLYAFTLIGIVCGDYFLPSIDCICSDLNLSQDVAAATFMSFATTAPELFMILVSTFVSESDIGIGAVVGSGMFNILGVATIGGLAATSPIKLDWWPLYRDSLVYVMAPIMLAVFLSDGEITLTESIILIVYYIFYYLIMYFNRCIRRNVKKWVKGVKRKIQNTKKGSTKDEKPAITISTIRMPTDGKQNFPIPTIISPEGKNEGEAEPEEKKESYKSYFISYDNAISLRRGSAASTRSRVSNRSARKSNTFEDEAKISVQSANFLRVENEFVRATEAVAPEENKEGEIFEGIPEEEEEMANFRTNFCTCPDGSNFSKFTWAYLWPLNLALFCTVPDCRSEKWRKFYPLTFLMCVVWIGGASFVGTWMISEIGDIFEISESVMGLTFLALGGSMPEALSTFIMARQGEGGLGFSNSLGGNTMDICLCLGVPWLIKCILEGQLKIKSSGIQFNALTLFIGIVILLTVSSFTKFHMNKRMGLICGFWYLIFIVFSLLLELEVISIKWPSRDVNTRTASNSDSDRQEENKSSTRIANDQSPRR